MENKIRTVRILILEDDLETISKLFERLAQLEDKYVDDGIRKDFSITVLSEYTQVEDYINKANIDFDIILLDRDCKAGGSFHVLNIEKFGPEKIISISSIPEYNEDARKLGITKVVHKNFEDLDGFADQVITAIKQIIE